MPLIPTQELENKHYILLDDAETVNSAHKPIKLFIFNIKTKLRILVSSVIDTVEYKNEWMFHLVDYTKHLLYMHPYASIRIPILPLGFQSKGTKRRNLALMEC